MKKYNISRPRKETDKNGNEKTYWDNVGIMLEFEKQDGSVSRIIKIPAIGLEANVFEERDRDTRHVASDSAPMPSPFSDDKPPF